MKKLPNNIIEYIFINFYEKKLQRKDFINFQVYFNAGHFNLFQQFDCINKNIANISWLK